MKNTYLTLFLLSLVLPAFAQYDIISVGANYANQTFYRFHDGTGTSVANTSWDIAFGAGLADAGIFVNEAVASSMSAPLPEVELYLTSAGDFSNVDTNGMTRIYNPEISWDAGAFNAVKDDADPFDLGWGSYDPLTHVITGTRIFCIKLRNGSYLKLQIESLADETYSFRYGNLDNSNEATAAIVKADYADKNLIYFSFESESVLDLEPAHWDLLFCRYYSPLDAGGEILEYLVTGVLSNEGVQVAQADGVDPFNANPDDYADQYSTELTVIGNDWKSFDLGTFQWVLPTDRAYFVQTPENELWRVIMVDFTGSSLGETTLSKTLLGEVGTTEAGVLQAKLHVFPNPAVDQVQVALDAPGTYDEAQIRVINQLGQPVWEGRSRLDEGLNVKTLQLGHLPAGYYQLLLEAHGLRATATLILY